MEKHLIADLDFPPNNQDVLIKHKSGEYWIGHYANIDGYGYWNLYELGQCATNEIECWWYLPE